MQETPVQFLRQQIHWRRDRLPTLVILGFPSGSDGKESTCNAGDLGSIPGLGRSPGEGHGNPLQHSCLENPHGQRSLVGYNPWDHRVITTGLPGKSQGSLFVYLDVQSCPTLCDPVHCSPPGRQEYWSRLPCPHPGDLPNPGIKPRSAALQVDSLPSEPLGKPKNTRVVNLSLFQFGFPEFCNGAWSFCHLL